MKIAQITKENIKHYNLDYILIDDFAADWATLESLQKTNDHRHPIHQCIEDNR